MMDSGTFLSKRGEQYALPANKNKLLGILGDVWHPVNNPTGYFNMGVAENTLMHKELLEYISAKLTVDGAIFGYGDSFSGSHRLKDVLAAFLTQYFRTVRPIQAADLAITSGVSAAIEACAFTLGDVDDGVLLAQPFYKAFPYNLSNRPGLRPVFVSFSGEDPLGPHSSEKYEQALLGALEQGIRVKALLLCNPHNPLGACASRHTLISYMKLCQKYNLHILSDEIYGLSCWENPETPEAPGFHSVLSINPHGIINPALVHVLWGISKDLGMNGFRLGCVVSQSSPDMIQALQTNSIFTCPSAFADKTTTMILSDSSFMSYFVAENQVRLRTRYAQAARVLCQNGISYRQSNAAFFVWADLFSFWSPRLGPSSFSQDAKMDAVAIEKRLDEHFLSQKVFLTCGGSCGSEEPGWFRITFAIDEDYLHEGLKRVVLALKCFEL